MLSEGLSQEVGLHPSPSSSRNTPASLPTNPIIHPLTPQPLNWAVAAGKLSLWKWYYHSQYFTKMNSQSRSLQYELRIT